VSRRWVEELVGILRYLKVSKPKSRRPFHGLEIVAVPLSLFIHPCMIPVAPSALPEAPSERTPPFISMGKHGVLIIEVDGSLDTDQGYLGKIERSSFSN
jgi:hypothetical protein